MEIKVGRERGEEELPVCYAITVWREDVGKERERKRDTRGDT